MHLSTAEKVTFHRQLLLPGFGETQQLRLKSAHVLIAGLGGLGNPVAQYLASAGVGELTLVDFDTVEASNLHRQVLFGIEDCGLSKALRAADLLQSRFPDQRIQAKSLRINSKNVGELISSVDFIADCTDNFEARYTLDSAASQACKPLMHGAIHRQEGQLALFHGNAGVGYTDIFPIPPHAGKVGNCDEEGVYGPLAGIIGCMMAQGIMEFLAFQRSVLDGNLIRFDGSDFSTHRFEIRKNQTSHSTSSHVEALSAEHFTAEYTSKNALQLIDVRELYEHQEFSIGGRCLPSGEVKEWLAELNTNRPALLYCNFGTQSLYTAYYIKASHPHMHILHLEGGLEAWRKVRTDINSPGT